MAETKSEGDKFQGLTSEQARLILAAGERNIAQKVANKKALTAAERKLLRERAMQGTAQEAPEGWALRAVELALRLGMHRNTVNAHIKDPNHPAKVDGLGWNVHVCREWYAANGILKASGLNDALLRRVSAEARNQESRAMLLEAKAKVVVGSMIPVEEITDTISAAASEAMTIFHSIPAVLPPLLAGKSHRDVEDILQSKIDEALSRLSELPWLSDEVKKKLQQLGLRSLQRSVQSFARPLEPVRSNGSVETLSSEPPTHVPDITG